MNKRITIYTDGGYKTSQQNTNAKKVKIVSAFWSKKSKEVVEELEIDRVPTLKQYSNLAEWVAIGMAVDYAMEQGAEALLIKTDSKTCCSWMKSVAFGEYRKKKNGKRREFATKNHQEVFDYLVEANKDIDIELEWVSRDKNLIGIILENMEKENTPTRDVISNND